MFYDERLETLEDNFENNSRLIRRKKQLGFLEEKLTITAISGPTGIGKTASVRDFAKRKNFKMMTIDCSFEPANHLAIYLHNSIVDIEKSRIDGCVLLLDFINEANDEFNEIIEQYRSNYLDLDIKVHAVDENRNLIRDESGDLIPEYFKVSYKALPENIFIVGEMRA